VQVNSIFYTGEVIEIYDPVNVVVILKFTVDKNEVDVLLSQKIVVSPNVVVSRLNAVYG
jgi:hypothetical protein